jgi:hypothetical protein
MATDKPSFDADILSGDGLATRGTLTVKLDPDQERLLDSQSPPLSQFDGRRKLVKRTPLKKQACLTAGLMLHWRVHIGLRKLAPMRAKKLRRVDPRR